MLNAQKEALQNRVRLRLLHIRELELRLYTRNCNTLAHVSSVLAGSAYVGIVYRSNSERGLGGHKRGTLGEGVYLLCLTVTMCLAIQCTLVASLTAMLGPGLALRGPDGAVAIAVEGMRTYYTLALLLELAAIGSMVVTAFAFTWANGISPAGKVLAGLVLSCTAYALVRYARHLLALFRLPDDVPAGSALLDSYGDRHRAEIGTGSRLPGDGEGVRACVTTGAAAELQPAAEGGQGNGTTDGFESCSLRAEPRERPGQGGAEPGRQSGSGQMLGQGGARQPGVLGLGPSLPPVCALRRSATQVARNSRAAVQEISARVHRTSGRGQGRRVAYARMGAAEAEAADERDACRCAEGVRPPPPMPSALMPGEAAATETEAAGPAAVRGDPS